MLSLIHILIYQITSIDTATVGQSKVIGVVAAKKNKIKKVTIPDRADCKGYRLNVTTIGNLSLIHISPSSEQDKSVVAIRRFFSLRAMGAL